MKTPGCNPEETWKDIPGYEGQYQVSNGGLVRSHTINRPLKPSVNHRGYARVWLSLAGTARWYLVHRLVADAFVPNPDSKPQVNHINGDKTDNRAENLEWCTGSENQMHSLYVLDHANWMGKRPVICLTTQQKYPSMQAAARDTACDARYILKCCQGKWKQAKGLRWAYLEVEA